MKIAIPTWNDKVSPVLDTASRLLVVEIEGHNESSRCEIFMDEQELSRRCSRIQALEVDTLICGAVSHPFARMLTAHGIHLISEISGPVENVLNAYRKGILLDSKFLMPGCKRSRSRRTDKPAHCQQPCKRTRKKIGHRKAKM